MTLSRRKLLGTAAAAAALAIEPDQVLVSTGAKHSLYNLFSALLDPALAGRALPWMLPPPLPELIGVMLLLVPLRDLLRAPARLPRERSAATARSR